MRTSKADKRRRRQLRERHFRLIRWRLKSYCWRLTALWCWLHLGSLIIFHQDRLLSVELRALSALESLLQVLDFSPVRLDNLPTILKVSWVLCICNFSLTQMAGVILYIAFAPVTFIIFALKPKVISQYTESKEKELAKPLSEKPRFPLQISLTVGLVTWFLLYGSSVSKGPIWVALLITAALFMTRLLRALPYATMADVDIGGFSSWLSKFASRYLVNVASQLSKKEFTVAQLKVSVRTQLWILSKVRYFSIFFRGSAGQRRAALVVLIRYIVDLGLLGGILVLFWALIFKLTYIPHLIVTKDALLASASHIIPGVAEPLGITMSKSLGIIVPFSGWLMFVVFIGPVASMYPMYQERYLRKIKGDYDLIRVLRRGLYQINELSLNILSPASGPPPLLPSAYTGVVGDNAPATPANLVLPAPSDPEA